MQEITAFYPIRSSFCYETALRSNGGFPKLAIQRRCYHLVADIMKGLAAQVSISSESTGTGNILTSNGTLCKHAIEAFAAAHPVSSKSRANGLPGRSYVLALGEFLLKTN